MDGLIDILIPYISNPWVQLVMAVISLASVAILVLPAPKEGSLYAKVHSAIAYAALLVGKAKEKAAADKLKETAAKTDPVDKKS